MAQTVPRRWMGLCGATAAVAAVAVTVAATDGEPTGLLLVLSVLTGVASFLLADRRAWLTTTALAAGIFLVTVAVGDEPHQWSFLLFIAFAAILGRAQRWMRGSHGSRAGVRR